MPISRRRLAEGLVRARRSVLFAAAAAATAAAVGCVQTPDPFDPWLAQGREHRSDTDVKSPPMAPLPDRPVGRYLPNGSGATTQPEQAKYTPLDDGPLVRLRLEEVIHRTIAHNLDIRVAGYDTAIDETRTMEAIGNFDPQVFSDLQFQRVDKLTPYTDSAIPNKNVRANNASTGSFTGKVVNLDLEALTTFDFGFRQNLISGGKIEVKQTVANTWTYPPRGIINPFYQNDLSITLNQPLLQNFGVAVNTARITISQNNQRVSLLDFRKSVEDTVLKVEQAYWQLVQADRDRETLRRLIAQSEELSRLLKNRLDQGQAVTRAQLLQATAQSQDRKVQLIQVEQQIGDLSDQLKTLMMDPTFSINASSVILPGDPGVNEPVHFNYDDQVATAMENRLELGQQQVRIASSEIAVMVAKNGLLPQLNLTLAGNVDGLSRTLNGGFDSEGNFNHDGFTSGVEFVFPLGNRAARAIWTRALLQRMQAINSYGSLIATITNDVKSGLRQVQSNWDRLFQARNAVLQYRELLRAIDTQIKSGDLPLTDDTVFNLLQYQQQLANAERTEHEAASTYNYAIANLEHAKGTILRYNNVILEQQELPPTGGDELPQTIFTPMTPGGMR